MVQLGSSQIYRGQGSDEGQVSSTPSIYISSTSQSSVWSAFLLLRAFTMNKYVIYSFIFLQALLMDSGEWSHFVQQQFCLAEDYYGHVGSRLFFQCQRWQRFAKCNFSAHWVWWWYGPAKVELQGQNIPKLPEELKGKTVKKTETVKDITDREWRVVLRARELSVCWVGPAGVRVSIRPGDSRVH